MTNEELQQFEILARKFWHHLLDLGIDEDHHLVQSVASAGAFAAAIQANAQTTQG